MRIDNSYLTNVNVGRATTASTQSVATGEGAKSPIEEASSHVPSAELKQLLEQVRQMPDVRGDKVEQVRQRLAAGVYLTADAANQTADAILKSADWNNKCG